MRLEVSFPEFGELWRITWKLEAENKSGSTFGFIEGL